MQKVARPVPPVASDLQETLPVDMSPDAKLFKENPPKVVPAPDEQPKKFADIYPPRSTTAELEQHPETASPEAPKDSKEVEVVGSGFQGGEIATSQAEKDLDEVPKAPTQQPLKGTTTEKQEGGYEDLFHATEEVTRQEQMEAKEKVVVPEGEDTEPKAKARAKAKASAKSRGARAKAKAKAKSKTKVESAKKSKAKETQAEEAKGAKRKSRAKRCKRALPDDDVQDPEPQVQVARIDQAQVQQQAPPANAAADPPEPISYGKKTFAGRNRPSTAIPSQRFDAIRAIFEIHVKSRVESVSAMEARMDFLLRPKHSKTMCLKNRIVNIALITPSCFNIIYPTTLNRSSSGTIAWDAKSK